MASVLVASVYLVWSNKYPNKRPVALFGLVYSMSIIKVLVDTLSLYYGLEVIINVI